jgi:phenylacetate-CoA ligase
MMKRPSRGAAVRTSVVGMGWPALPDGTAATLLALQHQFEQSEWWPADQLEEAQLRQLQLLLRHCWASVPFYRSRLDAAGWSPTARLDAAQWRRLPLLRREDIQGAGDAIRSSAVPKEHGQTATVTTSGSSGRPVTVLKTAAENVYWHAFVLRDHLWHRRDLGTTLAVIRNLGDGVAPYPKGTRGKAWGLPTGKAYRTGPVVALDITATTEQQLDWLQRVRPAYLLTLPSAARALAGLATQRGVALRGLQAVITMGEVCSDDVRQALRHAWNVPAQDSYSSQEVGYMALQGPEHEHYHLQCESALVEILDDRGEPCAPGQLGRVVATPLHNFAMPLIRYELGDFAEVGSPCPCGRGLPVVTRIAGRVRNMLRLPGGGLIWPRLSEGSYREIAPISQFQVAQVAPGRLEVRLVPDRPLTSAEEDALRDKINARIGHVFEIAFTYPAEIPRGPGGKYEDFRCELPAATATS